MVHLLAVMLHMEHFPSLGWLGLKKKNIIIIAPTQLCLLQNRPSLNSKIH